MKFAIAFLVIFAVVQGSLAGYRRPPPPPPTPAPYRCTRPSYGSWSDWSKCGKTCGDASQSRRRRCKPGNCYGKRDCRGPSRQSRSCKLPCCPVDGYFQKWSKWSDCNRSCGGGRQVRSRRCVQEQCGGKGCFGSVGEQRDCNTKCCPVDGYLTEWSKFGKCSAKCGKGTQLRDRECVGPKCRGKRCPKGALWEKRDCDAGCCPVNGGWGRWSSYGKCVGKCGYGQQSRSRGCNKPRRSCGGRNCKGDNSQSRRCDTGKPCGYSGY